MAQLSNERIAYFNGEFVPESQVLIPFRDRSFIFGDGVFDTTRTFDGRLFKLAEHIERFSDSLRYARIDPGLSAQRFVEVTEEVLRRNEHLRNDGEDYWVTQRATRGMLAAGADVSDHTGPTVIVECAPLPFAARARLFRDGIEVVVPAVRRTRADALSPRAKMHNYLNLIAGDLEVKARAPEAWSVLLDHGGNLCEGMGSNIFVVRNGVLFTPREKEVLPGVSRKTVMELARQEGFQCVEQDIDLFDAYTADEVFLTSTSLCLCPVSSVNGVAPKAGTIPGPVVERLSGAFAELVGCDFRAQYLNRLS